jgi:GGDEF domain-containing protein
MSEPLQRRRVLLAAGDRPRAELRELFRSEPLRHWDVVEADGAERAHFVLHLDPCDVVLLDGGDWSWLAGQRRAPVLFLTDGEPEASGQQGTYRLPREVAVRHPRVLAVLLDQAADFGELLRHGREAGEALRDARRQVGRLVNLLWEAAPAPGRVRWLTQRLMLERLEEEVLRARRYGGPLAVVLAEVNGPPPPEATWDVEQISRAKRRCDVAGQYGLNGFMLILPQTDAAGAAGCCGRLRKLIEHPAGPSGAPRVSFGTACCAEGALSVKGLLSRAEERLEYAKIGVVEGLPA